MVKVGDWVLCRAREVGWKDSYGAAVVEKVTAKTVYANAIYRKQFSIDDVIVMPDEAAAKKLSEQIASDQAAAQERISSAQRWARESIAKRLAKAIEARQGQDPKGLMI